MLIGGLNTNYEGKTQAAIDALHDGYDFAYIHVEAPDEMGHQGSVERKVKAIEYLDQRVIGPLTQELKILVVLCKLITAIKHIGYLGVP